MSDILSQDEVDSLLTGLTSGQVETETDTPGEIAVAAGTYDFTNQDRVIRGRMPTFEVINERFAREIRASLSKMLQTTVDISAESLDTLKFAEFGIPAYRWTPATGLEQGTSEVRMGTTLGKGKSKKYYNLLRAQDLEAMETRKARIKKTNLQSAQRCP